MSGDMRAIASVNVAEIGAEMSVIYIQSLNLIMSALQENKGLRRTEPFLLHNTRDDPDSDPSLLYRCVRATSEKPVEDAAPKALERGRPSMCDMHDEIAVDRIAPIRSWMTHERLSLQRDRSILASISRNRDDKWRSEVPTGRTSAVDGGDKGVVGVMPAYRVACPDLPVEADWNLPYERLLLWAHWGRSDVSEAGA